MFNEDKASGVGYNSDATDTDIDTGGHVIQLVHDIDDSWTVTAALEDLDDLGTFIGVLEYSGDAIDAHVTFLADEVLAGQVKDWAVHWRRRYRSTTIAFAAPRPSTMMAGGTFSARPRPSSTSSRSRSPARQPRNRNMVWRHRGRRQSRAL
ncbi:hypothetical protein [Devosia ginsengisoli]|uniref:hypothetical protein n=1 Tax=Devosia ginsengisoli TaxID=400770 RepID=UPI0026EC0775|nr:hypothetical protein [Devosia ginsengisoli]MCR6669772.1 hypothetical protein [Devosia ginsengisoli]